MEEDTQEIVEMVEEQLEAIVEAAPVEELPIEELPVEALADPGFWTSLWHGYLIGLDWIFPFIMVIGTYIVLRHLIWNSLRFNYRHYLECGEFVLCWGDDGNQEKKKDLRLKIAKEIKCEEDFVSWFAALLMTAVVLVIHALIALAWPITIILVMPLALVRLIGYRKRKKISFTQKLKGEHLAKEEQG